MGRPTKGLELLDALDASPRARRRLRVIFELMTGAITMAEAEDRLQLCASRIDALRRQMLADALSSLEPKTPGRPRKERPRPADDSKEAFEAEIGYLKEELEIERVRTEIAFTMPHLLKKRAPRRKRG